MDIGQIAWLIYGREYIAMSTGRKLLDHKLTLADRDLNAIQALVIFLLISLACYTVWLIYMRDWTRLVSLVANISTLCAALLVAKTATRLLTYNMLVRADDRAHDIVRVTHHCIAVINDLRGRVQFMKLGLVDGNRPLVGITQNAEAIQKRYEALYDRDLYRYLPGDVIDAIGSLSGSIFGLLVLVAEVTSALPEKQGLILTLADSIKRQRLDELFSVLDSELYALLTKVKDFRTSIE